MYLFRSSIAGTRYAWIAAAIWVSIVPSGFTSAETFLGKVFCTANSWTAASSSVSDASLRRAPK